MNVSVDLRRFDEEISRIQSHPVQTGKVMLYGSSFFTCWGYDRAAQQLAQATGGKLQVVNHGFGGSTVDDLLFHYPRLVTPYAPSAVVIRSGFNDICCGLSAQETAFLMARLVDWLQKDYPGIPIVLLKIFDVKCVGEITMTMMRAYNQMLDDMAHGVDNVVTLDINEFFYERTEDIGNRGKLLDLFVSDGLHLTDDSYEKIAPCFGSWVLAKIQNAKK